ncbi:MAG: hypothetical protein CND00_03640 [Cryomorphaceae bacterium MED-G14]|nr:MAG: hypothetical protein CND00_03640 [Cryomorphaceae bacterium MED-G14]
MQNHILKLFDKINLKYFAITYSIIIVIISLTPIPESTPRFKFFEIDKLIHFIIYLIFVISWGFVFNIKNLSLIRLLLFSIIFGITLEFLQDLLPFGRYFNFYDILANMAGVIIGIIILHFYKKKLL